MEKSGWGIISTAHIARKVTRAIKLSANANVVAVSSRSLEKAKSFADDLSIPKAYGDHSELLKDPEVQIVYIPLPTAVRKKWVLAAAAAKKHVLCEKPCAVSLADLKEMVDACLKNKVQFMDGVMLEHHTRLELIKNVVGGADFGPIKNMTSRFSFPGAIDESFCESNIRMNPEMEPFGALGDLGWYNIRFALDLFSVSQAYPAQTPVKVVCHYHEQGKGGLAITSSGILFFSGGGSATFHNSFSQCFNQEASVCSDRSSLQINDFVLPLNEANVKFTETKVQREKWTRHYLASDHHVLNCCQEVAMVEKLSSLAQSLMTGKSDINDSKHCFWPHLSLATQTVLDAAHQSAVNGGKPVEIKS
ncbi:unnamed protein product [Choristocarpus tenellus]